MEPGCCASIRGSCVCPYQWHNNQSVYFLHSTFFSSNHRKASSTSYTNNASFPLSLSGAVWYHDQQCQYLTPGNIPNPYTNATIAPALASQCETQWSSSFSAFAATESITGEIGPYTCTFPDGGYETDMYGVTWDPTATSPCCLSCTLSGGTARVLYWPTPAPNSAVSTLVDLDTNFTLYIIIPRCINPIS